MSRLFGGVIQNGYVVRNIEAAIRHWIDVLGVGHGFIPLLSLLGSPWYNVACELPPERRRGSHECPARTQNHCQFCGPVLCLLP
jgi:hypothetical protein